eukprot:1017829-Pyramimonas_sp.AAC.1
MATSTTVDTLMAVAKLAAMLTTATARPARAKMLIAATTMTASSRRRSRFWTCARGRRARAARAG